MKKETFPSIKTEIYTCKKCGEEWLQRHKVIKNADRSIKDIKSKRPKHCTECKTIYWNVKPRD